MDSVRELTADEFNERLMPIFRDVEPHLRYPGGHFNPDFFFPHWRRLMQLGVARSWEQGSGDAVLGAVFTENTFTGKKIGLVHFWFKRDGAPNAEPLMEIAEKAAREIGCILFHSSESRDSRPMGKKYLRLGFEPSEVVYRKVL